MTNEPIDLEQQERKKQISEFVLRYLAGKKKPVPETELQNKIYLSFNELLPQSVMFSLKAKKLITIRKGKCSLC